jgi:peptidyl-prolyl cis-trans isomerase SurA
MNTRIFIISLAVLGWTVPTHADVINRIIATVDDEPITIYEVQSVRTDGNAQQKFMLPPGNAANLPDKDILEAIIMTKLIGKEVEAQGIKASDAEVDNYIERIKNQGSLSDEAMKEALAKQGLTEDAYRTQVRGEIERGTLINREIGSRVNVTPQEVERYYKEHGSGGSSTTSDEQVRVRHIFLPLSPAASSDEEKAALDQMQDIRKHAVAGEDFATLANTHSRGPGAGQGGDLGFFKKGQMTKEIDTVAFSLKAGEISQPFRNDAGVHMIKVEEHRAAGEQTSGIDPEEAEQIKRKLYNEALRERYERWFQSDLKFRHQVENFLTTTPVSSSGEVSFKSARRKEQAAAAKEPEQKGFLRRWLPF